MHYASFRYPVCRTCCLLVFSKLNVERGSLLEFCILSVGDSLWEFWNMALAIHSMQDFCSLCVGDAAYRISVS